MHLLIPDCLCVGQLMIQYTKAEKEASFLFVECARLRFKIFHPSEGYMDSAPFLLNSAGFLPLTFM